MSVLPESKVHDIFQQATIDVREGKRLDEQLEALQNPELNHLLKGIMSSYEAGRGLFPEQLIGPGKLVSHEQQQAGIAALTLGLYDYFKASGIEI